MSLAAVCGWSVLRSLTISLVALPVCRLLSRHLAGTRGFCRFLIGTLLLVTFFTPELIVGYAYVSFFPSLPLSPVCKELFYTVLVTLKLMTVGVMMLYFAPPAPVSAEAIHCRRLAFRRKPTAELPWGSAGCRWLETAGFLIRGPVRSTLPAFAALFLLSFQEFEMASRLEATSWTVWLFDAQAGGLFLGESLRFAAVPLGCEIAVILPVLMLVLKSRRLPVVPDRFHKRMSLRVKSLLWVYLFIAVVIVFAVPLLLTGREAFSGFARLLENRRQAHGLAKEILTGITLAAVSGILTCVVSACFFSPHVKGRSGRSQMMFAAVLSLPGLLGSLVLSLFVLFVFQTPWFAVLYNTPVPMILSSILFLLPRAMLIHLLLLAVYPGEPQHLAVLLARSPLVRQRDRGRELLWQMRGRGRFWGAMLLCYWVYWDLTTTSILAPVGVTLAPVRLYNQMHFGHNAVLSAMTCLTVAVPLMLLVLAAMGRRRFLRWMLR